MSNYNSVIPTPQPLNPSPNMHPLKRKFEPVLLDRYPPKHLTEEAKRRGPFPDYVPMFAFPNDVSIVSSDERPRSTWHGFVSLHITSLLPAAERYNTLLSAALLCFALLALHSYKLYKLCMLSFVRRITAARKLLAKSTIANLTRYRQ